MTDRTSKYLVLPALAIIGAVFFVPFAFLALTSFWSQRPGSLLFDYTLTLRNYTRLLTDGFFFSVLFYTIWLALITVAICLALGLPIARWIARRARRTQGLLLVLMVLPLVSGALIQTLGLVNLLSLLGVVNGLLRSLSLTSGAIRFLGNESGVLIGLVQAFLPLMVLPLVTAFSKMPAELEAAARSLGAPPHMVWWRITLPLVAPGILAGSILVFFAAVTSFVTPQILGQGRVFTFGTVMFQQAALVNDWPFASALAIAMLALLAVLMMLAAAALRLLRRLRRGADA